ncbi:MAG: 3-oxoacyl-[acyl-carrier-protein] synthase III C-terminal domain-containing protein [Eubacteriales bacterium]|nr:3-oxoacyl-[acyl-carrier-protein] synthase III C-terminal domain-containing protein [Eubacteriales bacterium]
MKIKFSEKKITGILGVLPEKESMFDDEVGNYSFPERQTMRLKKVMGFEKHRLSKEESTASDFCIYGMSYLLEGKKIRKEEIGAIIVVTLSPDYFVPHISNIIHGHFQLNEDVLCMDISQGCCGYLLGLMQSFMLLDYMKDKKIVLFNVDILSKKVSKHDRNDFPLVGDAASITIVENDVAEKDIDFRIFTNGKDRDALIIPAGGFAMPSNLETSVMKKTDDGNERCLDNLHMDGAEVFSFVQTKVPPMIDETFKELNIQKDDIDYYLFHQPNKFMLKKLADKIGVPHEKLFMNVVENYGNPSGVSIPINIIHNLGKEMTEKKSKCCLSAFGSGLTWGMMLLELGHLDFCEMIESDL